MRRSGLIIILIMLSVLASCGQDYGVMRTIEADLSFVSSPHSRLNGEVVTLVWVEPQKPFYGEPWYKYPVYVSRKSWDVYPLTTINPSWYGKPVNKRARLHYKIDWEIENNPNLVTCKQPLIHVIDLEIL